MKQPWMPLYVQDFMLDTLDLEADELGVYFTMICLAWRHGDGAIPADMKELKHILQRRLANLHGLTFNRIVPKLLEKYFYRNGTFYYQKRVENELRIARELSEKQSRIAKERWSKTNKNNNLSDATTMPITTTLTVTPTKKEKKIDSWAVADATRPKVDQAFEEFWKAYPKRDGANPRKPAFAVFTAKLKAGATVDEIIAGAKACAIRDRDKVGTPYIPQAIKWLRDERWRDYAAPLERAGDAAFGWKPGKPTSAELEAKYGASQGVRLEQGPPLVQGGERVRPAERDVVRGEGRQQGTFRVADLLRPNRMDASDVPLDRTGR